MIRRTRQRDAVLHALESAGRPLTPAEIFDRARLRCPGLGLRTVYRHLGELGAAATIVRLDYPGQPLRYETAGGQHHAHFICNRCHRVFDLPGTVPDVSAKPPPGFRLTGQETIFYGLCANCSEMAET